MVFFFHFYEIKAEYANICQEKHKTIVQIWYKGQNVDITMYKLSGSLVCTEN